MQRDYIGADAAQANDHRTFADPHELANRDTTAEDNVVTNSDMTAEHRVVGKHYLVADVTIMPYVAPHHEKTAVANLVFPPPSSVPVLMVTFSRCHNQRRPQAWSVLHGSCTTVAASRATQTDG